MNSGVPGYLFFRERMAKMGLMKPLEESQKDEIKRKRPDLRSFRARYLSGTHTKSVRLLFEQYHSLAESKIPPANADRETVANNSRLIRSAQIQQLQLGNGEED